MGWIFNTAPHYRIRSSDRKPSYFWYGQKYEGVLARAG
jgi:hypothetical protein